MARLEARASSRRAATEPFVEFFRSTAPYVHAHRGRTFVLCFGGEAVTGSGFRELVHDVALLSALGIRLVLVHGARPQIDRRVEEGGGEIRYVRGRRVTDDVALACAKEAVGTLRVEIEALLSMGIPNSPMAGARIRVAAGNFVVAQPMGVVDGVDTEHTGEVRRIDAEGIHEGLEGGAVVLLSPLGYSVTGDVFNVGSHDVAAATASALRAEKLVSLVEGRGLAGSKKGTGELTPDDAEALLRRRRLPDDLRLHLDAAVRACRSGVRRAHLVRRKLDGGLLRELFTRDGVGTMVTSETYEGVRGARLSDVGGILELLEPLEREGILVTRSRELLETQIHRFTVIERDGMIIACAALHPFEREKVAEVACVAVHPRYRDAGRGDVLMAFIERRAKELGIGRLFVLTTRSAHWFRERGFEPATLRQLPVRKRSLYNRQRGSKVFVKTL